MNAFDYSGAMLALLLLGAFHGINPGMGWLFAVALGLQEQKHSAVWRALLPLAIGHMGAIAAAVILAGLIGLVLPVIYLKWLVAGILFAFGLYRLLRNRHPHWGGMRVGARDLAIWSFLMASAHGAGLMVLPMILSFAGSEASGHAHHAAAVTALPIELWGGLLATLVHSLGYLLVTGLVAVVVYERLGLRLLRTAWINLDVIWAAVLLISAVLTPLL